jgi:hypothetical protein
MLLFLFLLLLLLPLPHAAARFLRFAGPLAGASQRLASSADLAACRQQHAKAVTGPQKIF